MNRTSDPFVPRAGLPDTSENILIFLNQRLTYISIGAALLATALLIVGPLRPLMSRASAGPSSGSSASTSPGTALASLPGSQQGEAVARQFEPFTIVPDRPRNRVIQYTVRPGDTLMGIAGNFGLDRTTLFWANENALQNNVHML